MKAITVVMTTYNPEGGVRDGYARDTLFNLWRFLRAPIPIRLHVADDGSPEAGFIDALLATADAMWGTRATTTNAKRQGIGASLNRALDVLKTDYWLYITDDWLLSSPLDLAPALRLIDEHDYDLVRLGPCHPNLACTTRHHDGMWWLDIDPTKGGFAFATRPFLAHRSFTQGVGPFDEDVDAYATEQWYAKRVRVIRPPIRIAQGDYGLAGPWFHCGEQEVGRIDPKAG